MSDHVTYVHDAERRLRAGFVGCGGHAFRNIYPTLRYLPVDLVAVCDLDPDRAASFAKTFGAQASYTDHRTMLEREELDAAFVVTGYDRTTWRVGHPAIARDCLDADIDAWIEKPPVNDLDDIAMLREASGRSGKQLAVGLKKAFTPSAARLKAIVDSDDFGEVQSVSLRYPQRIPTPDEMRATGTETRKLWPRLAFLDHIGHPLSLLRLLVGPAQTLHYTRSPDGSGFASFVMASGATASIHLIGAQSTLSPLERTEVTGAYANAVVDNGKKLTYYRRVRDREVRAYGVASDFTSDIDVAPIVWEPEWSLGSLSNKAIFLLGYYNELLHFCRAVLDKEPVTIGGLDYAEEGIRIYDAFARGPNREIELC